MLLLHSYYITNQFFYFQLVKYSARKHTHTRISYSCTHELCIIKRQTGANRRQFWLHVFVWFLHCMSSGHLDFMLIIFQRFGTSFLLLPLPPEGTVATSPMPGILMLRPVFTRCPSVGFSRQFKPSRLRTVRERKREFKKYNMTLHYTSQPLYVYADDMP